MARIHEELYKKYLNDPDNHDGVVTHLEPDILESEAKWALGSITMNKANGGDGIPTELFQILKDDAVKVLHSICQQIWKTQQCSQDWKGQFALQSQRKAMSKSVQTTTQLRPFHMLVKEYSKSFKLASTVHELRAFGSTSWIEKRQREQRSNCQHLLDHRKSKEIPEKTSTSASLTMLKFLTLWITINCGKFLKRREYQTTFLASAIREL